MARTKRPDIKGIYITGFDVPTHEAVSPILRKPFTDDEMLAELAKALSSQSRVHTQFAMSRSRF